MLSLPRGHRWSLLLLSWISCQMLSPTTWWSGQLMWLSGIVVVPAHQHGRLICKAHLWCNHHALRTISSPFPSRTRTGKSHYSYRQGRRNSILARPPQSSRTVRQRNTFWSASQLCWTIWWNHPLRLSHIRVVYLTDLLVISALSFDQNWHRKNRHTWSLSYELTQLWLC